MAAAGAGRRATAATGREWDTIVVGAGVFGAWTAWHLRRLGQHVLLLDASGPANARASSGGESRVTRTIYGSDDVYTRMAWESLEDWRWLSSRSGLPILHQIGAWRARARCSTAWCTDAAAANRRRLVAS